MTLLQKWGHFLTFMQVLGHFPIQKSTENPSGFKPMNTFGFLAILTFNLLLTWGSFTAILTYIELTYPGSIIPYFWSIFGQGIDAGSVMIAIAFEALA